MKISDSNNNILDFSSCTKLTTFVYQYGSGVFPNVTAHVILPQNMLKTPNGLFQGFKGSVDFSPVLEEIGVESFTGASLTKGLVFPNTLKTIRDKAFYNATIPSIKFEGMDANLSCP